MKGDINEFVLERFKAGDKRYIDLVTNEVVDMLYRFANKMGRNHEDIEDIVSLACMRVLRNIPSLISVKYLKRYIWTTLKFAMIDVWRNKLLYPVESLHDMRDSLQSNEDLARDVIEKESAERILRIIHTLPGSRREVAYRKFVLEQTREEIAEELGITKILVKSRTSFARNDIRKRMYNHINA